MKTFKYLILAIHIIAVISVMVYTVTSDHAVTGKGFYKCEQSGNNFYLVESAGNFSVIYKGDHQGNVSSVYKSNQDESKVTIENFAVADEVYILEKSSLGYAIKKISQESLMAIGKSRLFVIRDIEDITDFNVDLSTNMVYITAINNGRRSASVFAYYLPSLLAVGSTEIELKPGEEPSELPPMYKYESVNGAISTAYFDGSNIVTDSTRLSETARDPYSYSRNLSLTASQSLKINTNILLIYLAYGIIGVILIILIVRLIEKRRRFIDLILLNEIFILFCMAFGVFMLGNIPLAIAWAVIASIANILIILFENRDIRVLCDDMKRISSGNLVLDKPKGHSIETAVLWRGMNEVKYLYEEYKYIQDTTTAAALRFLPHNIGAMFNCNSLDEIKAGDSVSIAGTFMALRTKKEITNELINLIENYEKQAEGTLLTGECSVSEIRMLFSKPQSEPLDLGLRFFSEIADDSACSLYFKDNFKISVVGSSTKSILNIASVRMETMEKMAGWFFDMGIRMVVTEEVKEANKGLRSPLRYIGYCYMDGKKTSFYEVLNVYGEKIRSNRLKCLEDFDRALTLMYQNDFYLARTAFTDILKVDPTDELTRWYLFICEKYLNNPELADKPCALDPRN